MNVPNVLSHSIGVKNYQVMLPINTIMNLYVPSSHTPVKQKRYIHKKCVYAYICTDLTSGHSHPILHPHLHHHHHLFKFCSVLWMGWDIRGTRDKEEEKKDLS